MNEQQADKIVELNTEESEQVVGGTMPNPVGPAAVPGGVTGGHGADLIRKSHIGSDTRRM